MPVHTLQELRKLLDYNPDTGLFIWKEYRGPNARKGNVAGVHEHEGYIRIIYDGESYRAHRLAWLFVHGRWPVAIDHINGDRSDNRIENLREVRQDDNTKNSRRRVDNTSGHTGVCWSHGANKWQARIARTHLGYFNDIDDAIAARKQAEKEHGYHENHGRTV